MDNDIDLTQLPDEQLDQMEWLLECEAAAVLPFGLDGFEAHYGAVLRQRMPGHVKKQWLPEFFDAYKSGSRRFLIKAARGLTKSTVFTIMMATYRLAKYPEDSVLIVQKGDDAGSKTAKAIAGIISENEGWKRAYPNIVPDKEQRWSSEGYEIKDTAMEYGAWRQKVLKARPKDPSFMGLGWSSGSIVGMHPMWLFVDDIHDEKNTRSSLDMSTVLDTFQNTILRTLNRPPGGEEPVCIVSYTPWDENDTYAFLENTGQYTLITTPIVIPDEKGFEYRGKKVRLVWDNVKDPLEFLDKAEKDAGPISFATQMLLDLTAAKGKTLKLEWLHKYPVEKLDTSWPCYFGVDYASTMDKVKDKDRDYFVVTFLRIVPGMGGVIWDGYREKLSRVEAKEKLTQLNSIWKPTHVGIEIYGKGEEFFVDMVTTTDVPVLQVPRKGGARLSKGEKFETVLARDFNNSQLWIGDIDTPFLKAFKDEWVSWDGSGRSHDDTIDGAYIAAYVAQNKIRQPRPTSNFKQMERQQNPFSALGGRQ